MDLSDIKKRLTEIEGLIVDQSVVELMTFDTPHGKLKVLVTDRLRRKCRKGRVWKSPEMLTALKNVAYGFDVKASRSRGGADGIFCLDRDYKPANSMMKKIFAQFLDKPDKSDPLVLLIEETLKSQKKELVPVRVVSHHMRLLGVLLTSSSRPQLVLVDYDNDKDS